MSYARPRAAYTRVLGGQAAMMGARNVNAAASNARTSAKLPIHAAVRARPPGAGAWALALGRAEAGGARNARGPGCGGMTSTTRGAAAAAGGNAATGAHSRPQRAQRTTRPAASGAPTSYSAAQDGQVIRMARSWPGRRRLATARA